jgi:hypothetical protein
MIVIDFTSDRMGSLRDFIKYYAKYVEMGLKSCGRAAGKNCSYAAIIFFRNILFIP